ncbi:hypothetical protein NDU88_003311 [Pleurodeles waltl]|uniref:Uncharacterized protein n=1 Tax=Pleurodeles waltl TaxID=8319 RepID=A0AAV7W4M3_PLEWA|nr:hypothetical protein NDU88_003311 [Pleurodeles waltl]
MHSYFGPRQDDSLVGHLCTPPPDATLSVAPRQLREAHGSAGTEQPAFGGPRKEKGTFIAPEGYMILAAPPGTCLWQKIVWFRTLRRTSGEGVLILVIYGKQLRAGECWSRGTAGALLGCNQVIMAPNNIRMSGGKAEKNEHTNTAGRMVTGGTRQRWTGMDTSSYSLGVTKEQDAELRQSEGVGKDIDWSKEEGDKFYSLTEYSDCKSSDAVQSDAEDNLSSELETSLSSAIGPIFKQRQYKRSKRQSGTAAAEVVETEHNAAAIIWDYSGISLCTPEKAVETCPLRFSDRGGSGEDVSKVHSEETMLQLIYGTIKELQTET